MVVIQRNLALTTVLIKYLHLFVIFIIFNLNYYATTNTNITYHKIYLFYTININILYIYYVDYTDQCKL